MVARPLLQGSWEGLVEIPDHLSHSIPPSFLYFQCYLWDSNFLVLFWRVEVALSPGSPLFPLLLFLWLISQFLPMACDAVNIQGTHGSVSSLGSPSCQALLLCVYQPALGSLGLGVGPLFLRISNCLQGFPAQSIGTQKTHCIKGTP